MRSVALSLLALFASLPARADGFWKHWGDGKAELDGYSLKQPRYGELRDGTAVLVFVTEDMSQSLRVKADPGKHPRDDVHPVLKLNAIRAFQTGIYDYKVMTSVFARTEAAFAVDKVTFSSTEWCGQVWMEWIPDGQEMRGALHSYFDGEADRQLALGLPPGGVMEDALPILVRGLRGDLLAPGEARTVPFLFSSLRARLEHKAQHDWGEAVLRRSKSDAAVHTTLGELRAFTITVAEKGGVTTTWTIESAAPHRILAWQGSDGEEARITGSTRLAYWQLNHLGDERYRKQLGLPR
jgi:hypothetical protein